MNIKSGTPTQITFNHEWKNNHGSIFYDWNILFDNGDAGIYVSKSNTLNELKFKQGVKREYITEEKNNKIKIKPYDPIPEGGQAQGNRPQISKEEGVQIKKSTAIRVAIITYKHADYGKDEQKQFFEVSKIYFEFLNNHTEEKPIRVGGILKDAAEAVGIKNITKGEFPLFNFQEAKDPIKLANEVVKYAESFLKKTK
jgi:hypothetical protein